jgi:hypothetical protein
MQDAFHSRFIGDEQGGGTVWGLFWFMLMVGMAGLAVDTTDGFRNRTMLQATADAAALAAAIDLPDQGTVVATATGYAAQNMGGADNGVVLDAADVHVGRWIEQTNSLITDDPLPDAVMVTVRRAAQNDNPVPVNFLRIIGLETWDVQAQAVAQRFIPMCLRDGLIARQWVNMSSNNSFVNQICVHGQQGVNIQSNNYFEEGVIVSMYDLDTLELPASGFNSNPGLKEALREQGLDPRMVNHVDEIMQQMLDLDPAVLPDYIDASLPVIEVDEKFDLSTAEKNRVYHVKCKPNKNAQIPSNSTVSEVVIIAECELHIGAKAKVTDAVLGSRSGGNGKIDKANVNASANVQLGEPDGCAEGGGVQIFSNATIHTASSTRIDGVQMVAAGDIELGAQDFGINGISAQSGQDITLTSNNMFGLCSGGAPDLFTVPYYRLVL